MTPTAAFGTTPTTTAKPTPTASGTLRFRPGFIHIEGAATKFLSIQTGYRIRSSLVIGHVDERETA